MTDRFTIRAAEAVQNAQQLATTLEHGELTPLHLLAVLVSTAAGESEREGAVAAPLLAKAGVRVDQLRRMIDSELKRLPKVSGGSLSPNRNFAEVLQTAQKLAERMKDQYTAVEHLLLALAEVKSDAREVLSACGASREMILAALKDFRGSSPITSCLAS